MHNPLKSSFNLILPDDFFIGSVVEKYNKHFSQHNFVQNHIIDIFNESIQSVTFPEIGYNVDTQTTQDVNHAGYENNIIPKTSEQSLIDDKKLGVTFRHVDGFMTYFMALELIYAHYQMGGQNPTKRKTFEPIILQTLSTHNRDVICSWKMYKCLLVGITPLTMAFNETERDVQTFDLTFSYTEFNTTINTQEPIVIF